MLRRIGIMLCVLSLLCTPIASAQWKTAFQMLEDYNEDGLSPIVVGSATNTTIPLFTPTGTTTGTVANGFGGTIPFVIETTAGNETGVILEAKTTDVDSATEDFNFNIYTMASGATAALRATLNDSGLILTTGIDLAGDLIGESDEMISNATDGEWTITADTVLNVMGTTGGLKLKVSEATATLSGASTDIDVDVPAGAILVGAQLRVDTLITSAAAASWDAAYKTGATQAITTGQAFDKDTKVNTFFDSNNATAITSDVTKISITPNADTFTGGVVRAMVYYYSFEAMANAP